MVYKWIYMVIKSSFVLLIFLMVFCFIVRPASAQTTGYINVTQEQNSDTFLSAETLEINAKINGDLFAAARTITINQPVDGNVFLAGENVNIKNSISGSSYVAARRLTVDAPIYGSLRVAAENVEVKSIIGRTFNFFAKNVYIPGTGEIEKDAYGYAESLVLDGKVGKNLTLLEGEGRASVNGKVMGNIYYSNDLNVTDRAFVGGEKIEIDKDSKTNESNPTDQLEFRINRTITILLRILFFTFVAFVVLKLKPQVYTTTMYKVSNRLIALIGKGILSILLQILLIMFLTITIIGIPVAILLVITYIITYLVIAPIPFVLFIGNKLLSKNDISILSLLVGYLIITLLLLFNNVLYNLFLIICYVIFSGVALEKVQKLISKS